ncbi:MAG: hypothetical protein ABIH82_02130 [Candidatus Woesearchaeota archaeon]
MSDDPTRVTPDEILRRKSGDSTRTSGVPESDLEGVMASANSGGSNDNGWRWKPFIYGSLLTAGISVLLLMPDCSGYAQRLLNAYEGNGAQAQRADSCETREKQLLVALGNLSACARSSDSPVVSVVDPVPIDPIPINPTVVEVVDINSLTCVDYGGSDKMTLERACSGEACIVPRSCKFYGGPDSLRIADACTYEQPATCADVTDEGDPRVLLSAACSPGGATAVSKSVDVSEEKATCILSKPLPNYWYGRIDSVKKIADGELKGVAFRSLYSDIEKTFLKAGEIFSGTSSQLYVRLCGIEAGRNPEIYGVSRVVDNKGNIVNSNGTFFVQGMTQLGYGPKQGILIAPPAATEGMDGLLIRTGGAK